MDESKRHVESHIEWAELVKDTIIIYDPGPTPHRSPGNGHWPVKNFYHPEATIAGVELPVICHDEWAKVTKLRNLNEKR